MQSAVSVIVAAVDLSLLVMTIAWAYIGLGTCASKRRPETRTGYLMTFLGISWVAAGASLSMGEGVFAVSHVYSTLWVALLIHMLMSCREARPFAADLT